MTRTGNPRSGTPPAFGRFRDPSEGILNRGERDRYHKSGGSRLGQIRVGYV